MSLSSKPVTVRIATALFSAVWLFGAAKLVRSLSMTPSAGGHSFTIFAFAATYSVMAMLIVYLWQGASWARGGLFVLFVIAIAPGLVLVLPYIDRIPWLFALTVGQTVAALAGFFIVFRKPTASWFKRPDTTIRSRGPRR